MDRTDYLQNIVEGNRCHLLIESKYKFITKPNDNVECEYSVPNNPPLKNVGYADIVNLTTNEVFEIKPNSNGGITRGRDEVDEYVNRATDICKINLEKGTEFENYTIPYPWDWQNKVLEVILKENGLILYRVKEIDKRKLPEPKAVAVPVNILKDVEKLYGKVITLKNITPIAVEVLLRSELMKMPVQNAKNIAKFMIFGTVSLVTIAYVSSLFSGGATAPASATATIFASAILIVSVEILNNQNPPSNTN